MVPQHRAFSDGWQQDPCSLGVQQGLGMPIAVGSLSAATFDGVDGSVFGVMAISVAVLGFSPFT
jgi:hypothetical protein